MTYLADEGNEILPFDYLENGTIQLVLTPFAPMSLDQPQIQQSVRFSTILGDVPMISILSGKKPLTVKLNAMSLFDHTIFYLYFVIFIIINLIMAIHQMNRFYKQSDHFNMIRILFKQSFTSKQPIGFRRILFLNLFALTGFFHLFITSQLLSFFTFVSPVEKIDSLNQLYKQTNMEICIFDGEQSVELMNEPQNRKFVKDRLIVTSMLI